MAHYYRNCPSTQPVQPDPKSDSTPKVLSEFDKLRETLLADDLEEGWTSELRRYLSAMERDVTKETDLVEWWQVVVLAIAVSYPLTPLRTMRNSFLHSHESQLIFCLPRLHLFPANGCSQVANKLRLTAEHPFVQ